MFTFEKVWHFIHTISFILVGEYKIQQSI